MDETKPMCDEDYWRWVEFELRLYTCETLEEIFKNSDLKRLMHLSDYLIFIRNI